MKTSYTRRGFYEHDVNIIFIFNIISIIDITIHTTIEPLLIVTYILYGIRKYRVKYITHQCDGFY